MKIGIDISQIVYEGTGVARFTAGLVNAILDNDKTNQWVFFFSSLRKQLDSKLEQEIITKGHQLLKWKLPPTLLSFLWNDLHQLKIKNLPAGRQGLKLTPIKSGLKIDWFITSDWTEPLLNIQKATVVHDLTFLRYPETVDAKIRKTQTKRLHWVKQESKIIFADSEATKNDLTELLKIDKKRISVNYPGVEVVKPNETIIRQILKKYNLTKPFILAVGKIEPRKNLKRLIEAFQQYNNKSIDLVIVGPSGWGISNFKFQISNLKILGYVSDSELYSLYSSCLFFIYPSIWEGFGYPLIEAMKLGAPVTCSNTSSIAEIAGDAALMFNPTDINQMIQCINIMSRDDQLRNKLIEKGFKRSKIFTWRSYYNKLIETLSSY